MYITTCSQQIGPVLIHLSRSILAGGTLALHFVTPCVNYNSLEILLSPRNPETISFFRNGCVYEFADLELPKCLLVLGSIVAPRRLRLFILQHIIWVQALPLDGHNIIAICALKVPSLDEAPHGSSASLGEFAKFLSQTCGRNACMTNRRGQSKRMSGRRR